MPKVARLSSRIFHPFGLSDKEPYDCPHPDCLNSFASEHGLSMHVSRKHKWKVLSRHVRNIRNRCKQEEHDDQDPTPEIPVMEDVPMDFEQSWDEHFEQHEKVEPSLHRTEIVEEFPGAAQTKGEGLHLFDQMEHINWEERKTAPYYPFSCLTEFEMAAAISNCGLSQSKEEVLYQTKYVCCQAFKTPISTEHFITSSSRTARCLLKILKNSKV